MKNIILLILFQPLNYVKFILFYVDYTKTACWIWPAGDSLLTSTIGFHDIVTSGMIWGQKDLVLIRINWIYLGKLPSTLIFMFFIFQIGVILTYLPSQLVRLR